MPAIKVCLHFSDSLYSLRQKHIVSRMLKQSFLIKTCKISSDGTVTFPLKKGFGELFKARTEICLAILTLPSWNLNIGYILVKQAESLQSYLRSIPQGLCNNFQCRLILLQEVQTPLFLARSRLNKQDRILVVPLNILQQIKMRDIKFCASRL